jgi:peptide-N4-(N-acetyl-beta-glucosaminyl)asparagine amidase
MAFVLHRSQRGTAAIGTDGCGIGYDGISRSIAVELDTWQTVDRCNDPSNNHISVHTRGTLPNSSHHANSLGCTEVPFVMNDGVAHLIEIQYDSEKKVMDIWADGTPLLEVKVDVMQMLSLEDGKVWFGVVGATGGVGQIHELLSLSVNISE